MVGTPAATDVDSHHTADVPLSVFSQSSSLMSDRATQAMEKALRNLANPNMEANVASVKVENSRGPVNEDFLRDIQSDQRNYAKRDAADLFTAPALANDKDGKLTAREMSLPSAFFSREGLEDSAHAVIEVSDSEDAEVNQRANQSVSGLLDSERSVGSDSETDRDSTIFLGNCATEDLDLVENAILRLLREDGRLSSKQHQEDSTKLKDALGLNEHLEGSEVSSAGSVDLQLLSKLLDQVQTLRDQKYQHRQNRRAARSLSRGRSVWDISKRGGKGRKITKDEMKKAVEAATLAAKSAAETAKTASALVTRNSEAVNKLVHSMKSPSSMVPTFSSKKKKKKRKGDPDHSSSSDSDDSSDTDNAKDIAKKIVNQNRFTHVVLGVMLVSSFVWRYIVVKVVKRVKNKVSDPWGYVGGILTDNFKSPEKDKAEAGEETSSGLNLPQLSLPPILQREEETQAASTSDAKEERVLSFGNILQVKPNSDK
ncbi:hypothetical protein M758_12G088400 [Ceratodon purpureus]|nr:hypothetical protein M758_12G088400 [Ceratodon purpureus]